MATVSGSACVTLIWKDSLSFPGDRKGMGVAPTYRILIGRSGFEPANRKRGNNEEQIGLTDKIYQNKHPNETLISHYFT